MASITIRNLDDEITAKLRMRAASYGRSMEEEARCILRDAVQQDVIVADLAAVIRERFVRLGGVELAEFALPHREIIPEPLHFQ